MKKFLILLFILLIGNFALCNDITVFRLNNGQTLIVKEVPSNPIVTIDTWIKTGSINENDKNNGVSHFLEHLFFKGTEKYPTGEFDRILEAKGAINNAATSKDFTHYYITIPSEHLELALEMHSDMLQHPSIPQKELENERKVVLEEIAKDINSPNTKVYNNLMDLIYTTHPYKRKVIGTADIIETITRNEILNYFDTYYTPANMVTVIVGDVDTQKIVPLVEKAFNSHSVKPPKNKFKKEVQLKKFAQTISYMDTQSGYMLIGFRSAGIKSKELYALDVLSTILSEGRSSIFYKNIKDGKQLAFEISTGNMTMKDDSLFLISANFVPENYEKLENNIFEEISNIQQYGVTEKQLEIAKNIIEQNTFYSRESVSDIAEELGYSVVVSGNIKLYEDYISKIKQVSANDIKKVANKYLNKNNAAVSIVLPKNIKEKPVLNSKINKNKTVLLQSSSKTQKYKLANNSTLLYTPNNYNDIVAISIFVNGGEFIEEIAGTGKLTASTILSGTKNYSKEELANFLEENGIKISATSKADVFILTALTTRKKYDKTLDILKEIINNCTFNNFEIEKAKQEKLSTIKRNRDFPLQKAIEEHNTLIYQGSVYSNSTKILEKTYPKITRENIIQYYNKLFNPENITISVNGNVDTEKIKNDFSEIFINKNDQQFSYDKYTVKKNTTPKVSEIIDKNSQTGWLLLAWQTDGVLNAKDHATLSVINSLLGSGMSSRLFKNLRDKEGLAYQLGSSFNPNIKCGSFVIYIGTNPKTLNLSKTKLFEEIKKLKLEYVNSEELQEAKSKLLGQFAISQETNLEKSSTIGWFEASGRGFDFEDNFKKLVAEVTASDILKVANKYFNTNYVLTIVKNK